MLSGVAVNSAWAINVLNLKTEFDYFSVEEMTPVFAFSVCAKLSKLQNLRTAGQAGTT